MNEEALIARAKAYIAAVEGGATGAALAQYFHPDVVLTELPNRLVPGGATRGLPAILEAAERGQRAAADQRYRIRNVVACGNQVLLERAPPRAAGRDAGGRHPPRRDGRRLGVRRRSHSRGAQLRLLPALLNAFSAGGSFARGCAFGSTWSYRIGADHGPVPWIMRAAPDQCRACRHAWNIPRGGRYGCLERKRGVSGFR